ncbi:MAG: guanylate kinase [Acetatifactor sp.]|nr:guanylate kinase [Acetatifactor sp.]
MNRYPGKEKGILIVISGFSGAGKGTLVKSLISRYGNYALSVSMTTRNPRPGETDGVEYFFTDRENFEKTIAEGGLVEYAEYCGNYYGTPKAYVDSKLAEGKDIILEIEIQGALKIKKQFPDSLLLFVTPPDADTLKNRLTGRGTETEDVILKRMARAQEESEGIEAYDYIVVNDNLDECVDEVHELVSAARRSPVRRQDFIKEIREELLTYAKGAQK